MSQVQQHVRQGRAHVSFFLSPELNEQVEAAALATGRNKSTICRWALRRFLTETEDEGDGDEG